jgi:transcription initiation factor TFIIE subunit alpha
MEIATPAANGGSKPANKGQQTLTEIPSSLRTLARLVVRGFHSIEDALVIDMLVRYPCLREDDVSALLKFDKKNLRSRMAALKNDKLVQVKLAFKCPVIFR